MGKNRRKEFKQWRIHNVPGVGYVHFVRRTSLGETTLKTPRYNDTGEYLRGSTGATRCSRRISVACRNWTATMTWWNSSIYHPAMSHLISGTEKTIG